MDIRPQYANLKISGGEMQVPPEDLNPRQVIIIKPGERIPVDAIVTQGSSTLDTKALTGESEPRHVKIGSHIYSGSINLSGVLEARVLKASADSTASRIIDMISNADNRRAQTENFAEKFTRYYTPLVTLFGILVMILPPMMFEGAQQGAWIYRGLIVLVAACPCGLLVSVPLAFLGGIGAASRQGVLIKGSNFLEALSKAETFVFDKTGTLTGDSLILEYYMDILGNESQAVLDLAYLNSLYHTGVSNHLDAAILRYQEMPGKDGHFQELEKMHPKLDELPFNHERKFASVLVKGKEKNLLIIKGSVDEVCRRCGFVEYKGNCNVMEEDGLASVHAVVDEMTEDGMKVLAVAYKELGQDYLDTKDEQNFVLLGYLAFFDAPKQTAAAAISKLQKLHVGIRVLTGDQESVAISICRRLGIDTAETLTGAQLENLIDDEAPIKIERTTVFSELSPKQKAQIVQTLQSNGHTVGFLGDGMNDLPAVVESDVGISVDTAAEAVREGADVILLKKDLNVLEEGIKEGRKAFANVSKYIRITASSNFGNIFSIVVASVFLPFFPMTSVQLLLLNLLYDMLCLVLPWDNVDEEICARPLEWSGRTLGRFMRFFGPISSFFDIITFSYLFFVLCPSVCGGSFAALADGGQLRFIAVFQTGWFLESMWTQVLILHLLRTQKVPMLQSRPSRPVMVVTMLGILFFTILTFTPVGTLIGLTALPLSYFGFLVVIVLLYLLFVTLAKGRYLKKYHELL